MRISNSPRVLFGALDWGHGHTTRSLPLIQALREEHLEVVFAGSPWQQRIVRDHFPDLECLDLPGYQVRYATTALGFMPRILAQIPQWWKQIKRERAWLADQVLKREFHGLVSDNRYGLHHPSLESVFITHQLRVQAPGGSRTISWIQRLHYSLMRPFQQVWVPDQEAPFLSLAGELAHPQDLPPQTKYIGWLSALTPIEELEIPGQIMVLLSGPEPQRTIISDLLWEQIQQMDWDRTLWFIEGKKEAPTRKPRSPLVIHRAHLSASELSQKMAQTDIILCRSGYSTLMDLIRLGKPAILIPTPGQTEQEYLGRRLKEASWFSVYKQKDFSLKAALEAPIPRPPAFLQNPSHFLKHQTVVREWARGLWSQTSSPPYTH